jgi:DNA-directed RNA polymerase specialized sigma24 family protein
MCVLPEHSPSGSFEALATSVFDRLYNFAYWLTQNRQKKAEDLARERS